jgi:acyl dehydratase
MAEPASAVERLQAAIGRAPGEELGVTEWFSVDQELVNRFAECTCDYQWIHVDVERAKRESPFGGTIVHGYLVFSLLPHFSYEIGIVPASVRAAINYGAERCRFPSPVRVPSRIRDRVVLVGLEDKGQGRVLMTVRHTVEIEGEDKPALVADTLAMIMV